MNKSLKKALLSIVLTTLSGGLAAAQKQAPHPVTNVLLVHGAFADSSSWKKVVPLLEAKGLHVATVVAEEAVVASAHFGGRPVGAEGGDGDGHGQVVAKTA